MWCAPTSSASANRGPSVALLLNQNGVNYGKHPDFRDAGTPRALGALGAGESVDLIWDDVLIPEQLGLFAITAKIRDSDETNYSNNEVTRWFTEKRL